MNTEVSRKYIATSSSLFIHAVVLVLLALMARSCGTGIGNGEGNGVGDGVGDGYMSLDIAALGDSPDGFGEAPAAPAAPSAPATESTVENVTTEETSDVRVQENKNPKPVNRPVQNPKPDAKPTVNNTVGNALDALNNNGNDTGQGNTQGDGNQGVPDGTIGGTGVFNGGGGSGSWSLKGRTMNAQPRLDEKPRSEGTVIVAIYVDKQGNVTSASVVDYKGATEGRAELEALAIKAAKSAKFSTNASSPSQRGTITVNFKLR